MGIIRIPYTNEDTYELMSRIDEELSILITNLYHIRESQEISFGLNNYIAKQMDDILITLKGMNAIFFFAEEYKTGPDELPFD
ncbi:hypothetical protein SAMN02745247_02340 [Butyrivibrio hungatei DSM 14810]|uniref:Uncharacterized protein n=1 Tax=Butyrivibrio hungatei DSM 14810 TaxID=1121132 RepID=A0A1M7SRY4_9FIRM|nr:hypothetical protein [Butyrivibrio hungatei]SHN61285.1 hypothetical protein SAMN02745247_02340 [Butyrivibrio hungatei DSM 14810]